MQRGLADLVKHNNTVLMKAWPFNLLGQGFPTFLVTRIHFDLENISRIHSKKKAFLGSVFLFKKKQKDIVCIFSSYYSIYHIKIFNEKVEIVSLNIAY